MSDKTTIDRPSASDMKRAATVLRQIVGGHCSFAAVSPDADLAWTRVADWLDTQGSVPDPHERSILLALSDAGGWTSGQIAKCLGHQNVRKHGAIIRQRLLDMESLGWVGRIDDKAPVAWRRTPQGKDALDAH